MTNLLLNWLISKILIIFFPKGLYLYTIITDLFLVQMAKILHKRSKTVTNATPTLPTKDELEHGELAINYADGYETITIKNSNDDIVSFKSQAYIDNNDLFIKDTKTKSGIVRKNGGSSSATGLNAFAEGYYVTASGSFSHAEGYGYPYTNNGITYFTEAKGTYSHAEGCRTQAIGDFGSHSEGENTIASGISSHSEGNTTTASGKYSHAEGAVTSASGEHSHAEGNSTTASGHHAHAEGGQTVASGGNSHAEGGLTVASGEYSHAEGIHTIASLNASHAEGRCNVASTLSIHSVGIGADTENRKNAEDICFGNGYKYLIGLGNYDGTNLSVTNGDTESVNPDVKSVQEILNKLVEKAGGLSALFS